MNIQNIISVLKKALFIRDFEPGIREEFLQHMSFLNIRRLMIGFPVILALILVYLYFDIRFIIGSGAFPFYLALYGHLSIALFSIVSYLIIRKILKKPEARNLNLAKKVVFVFFLLFIIIDGLEVYSTLKISGSITVFLFSLFAITAFIFFSFSQSLWIYIIGWSIGTVMTVIAVNGTFLVLSNIFNISIFTVLSWLCSRVLYYDIKQIFINRRMIEDKNTELHRAYRALEEREKLIEKELELARKMQSNFLPSDFSDFPQISIAVRYLPLMKVGGDIYDICHFSDNSIRILLADVTGHGVEAGLVTMLLKSEYEKRKMSSLDPSSALRELNESFIKTYSGLTLLFPAIIIDIDLGHGKIIYASGGHFDQYMIRAGGEIIVLSSTGTIIGAEIESVYTQREVDYRSGDRLALFTDGLIEEFDHDGNEFGEERLIRHLKDVKSPGGIEESIQRIINDLRNFTGTCPMHDDITLILIEKLG